MSDLGEFQGKPVVASKVIVKKAGDGLTKPLAAEPRAFRSGDRVPMLLWGTWGSIGFDPTKEGHGFVQVHDFDTEEAAVLDHVDLSLLEDLMSAQREAVLVWEREQLRVKNEEKGIIEFPGMDGDRPDDMSDADWEESARSQAPASLGAKRAKKEQSGG